MTAFPVSDTLIRQHATGESYSRGDDYARSGRVSALSVRDDVLSASVQGSEFAPYHVRVSTHDGIVTDATCTCLYSYGGWCKHIVAALLVAATDPGAVEERTSLVERLAVLDRDGLETLLIQLVAHDPAVADAIDRLVPVVAVETPGVVGPPLVDAAAIKARIRSGAHGLRHMHGPEAYVYGGSGALGARQELEPARAFLEAGHARAALDVLRAIIESWNEQWEWIDDSDGNASDLYYSIEPLLTEALLSASLSKTDLDAWADQLDEWMAELGDYGIDAFFDTLTAARTGWDDPALVAVLRGDTDVLEQPEDPELEETDELIEIRLRVLARLGQDEEALRLAAAVGHVVGYATARIRRGEFEQAARHALAHMTRPSQALDIAGALYLADESAAALRVAERGLDLDEHETTAAVGDALRAQLAAWLRGIAEEAGALPLAQRAAATVVVDAPSLEAWREAQRLAGSEWPVVRTELLARVRQSASYPESGKLDILLHEGLIDDAIQALGQYAGHSLIARVADAALATRPDWVIGASRARAEAIMDPGKSEYYSDAARWLARMKAASRNAGQDAEFRAYLAETIDKHNRKYKLVPLLRELQR